MKSSNRLAIFVAMCLFSVVSIWTTYVSLKDSILPRPTFPIAYAEGRVHELSIFALALSLAIGLMLFALKLSIIDGQKRLNFFGLIGLTVVASISIAFNMDVLYRVADHDFFLRYSESRVRTNYEEYLAKVQTTLNEKKGELEKQVAKQEGELESEVKGLREKPAGYGTEAKKEEYRLTLLEKTAQVDLQNIEAAIAKKAEVDKVLTETSVTRLDDVNKLQDDLRVQIKDLAAMAGTSMPQPVKLESPLFAVFQKLSNFRTIGPLEILVLCLGFLLDLGDIIGYSLVPNQPDKKRKSEWSPVPDHLPGPEIIRAPEPAVLMESAAVGASSLPLDSSEERLPSLRSAPHPRKRPFRFRR